MAQQTINVGTSPNDGTGTPLRTAFQYTNSNFSELYTAVGPSGNNIVVPGSATITGDLTVDTSTLKVDSANNRVGIGIASPIDVFQVSSNNPSVYITDNSIAGSDQANLYFGPNTVPTYAGILVDILNDTFNIRHNSSTRLSIGSTGIFTWQNVGGVAGTAMTLNSTGLGVGASPSYKIHAVSASDYQGFFRNSTAATGVLVGGVSGGGVITSDSSATKLLLGIGGTTAVEIDANLNVGVGVTPLERLTIAGSGSFGGTGNIGVKFHSAAPASNNLSWLLANDSANSNVLNLYYYSAGVFSGRAFVVNQSGNFMVRTPSTPPTIPDNEMMVFNLTSNTNLRISVKGTDGTTRTANITLA